VDSISESDNVIYTGPGIAKTRLKFREKKLSFNKPHQSTVYHSFQNFKKKHDIRAIGLCPPPPGLGTNIIRDSDQVEGNFPFPYNSLYMVRRIDCIFGGKAAMILLSN